MSTPLHSVSASDSAHLLQARGKIGNEMICLHHSRIYSPDLITNGPKTLPAETSIKRKNHSSIHGITTPYNDDVALSTVSPPKMSLRLPGSLINTDSHFYQTPSQCYQQIVTETEKESLELKYEKCADSFIFNRLRDVPASKKLKHKKQAESMHTIVLDITMNNAKQKTTEQETTTASAATPTGRTRPHYEISDTSVSTGKDALPSFCYLSPCGVDRNCIEHQSSQQVPTPLMTGSSPTSVAVAPPPKQTTSKPLTLLQSNSSCTSQKPDSVSKSFSSSQKLCFMLQLERQTSHFDTNILCSQNPSQWSTMFVINAFEPSSMHIQNTKQDSTVKVVSTRQSVTTFCTHENKRNWQVAVCLPNKWVWEINSFTISASDLIQLISRCLNICLPEAAKCVEMLQYSSFRRYPLKSIPAIGLLQSRCEKSQFCLERTELTKPTFPSLPSPRLPFTVMGTNQNDSGSTSHRDKQDGQSDRGSQSKSSTNNGQSLRQQSGRMGGSSSSGGDEDDDGRDRDRRRKTSPLPKLFLSGSSDSESEESSTSDTKSTRQINSDCLLTKPPQQEPTPLTTSSSFSSHAVSPPPKQTTSKPLTLLQANMSCTSQKPDSVNKTLSASQELCLEQQTSFTFHFHWNPSKWSSMFVINAFEPSSMHVQNAKQDSTVKVVSTRQSVTTFCTHENKRNWQVAVCLPNKWVWKINSFTISASDLIQLISRCLNICLPEASKCVEMLQSSSFRRYPMKSIPAIGLPQSQHEKSRFYPGRTELTKPTMSPLLSPSLPLIVMGTNQNDSGSTSHRDKQDGHSNGGGQSKSSTNNGQSLRQQGGRMGGSSSSGGDGDDDGRDRDRRQKTFPLPKPVSSGSSESESEESSSSHAKSTRQMYGDRPPTKPPQQVSTPLMTGSSFSSHAVPPPPKRTTSKPLTLLQANMSCTSQKPDSVNKTFSASQELCLEQQTSFRFHFHWNPSQRSSMFVINAFEPSSMHVQNAKQDSTVKVVSTRQSVTTFCTHENKRNWQVAVCLPNKWVWKINSFTISASDLIQLISRRLNICLPEASKCVEMLQSSSFRRYPMKSIPAIGLPQSQHEKSRFYPGRTELTKPTMSPLLSPSLPLIVMGTNQNDSGSTSHRDKQDGHSNVGSQSKSSTNNGQSLRQQSGRMGGSSSSGGDEDDDGRDRDRRRKTSPLPKLFLSGSSDSESEESSKSLIVTEEKVTTTRIRTAMMASPASTSTLPGQRQSHTVLSSNCQRESSVAATPDHRKATSKSCQTAEIQVDKNSYTRGGGQSRGNVSEESDSDTDASNRNESPGNLASAVMEGECEDEVVKCKPSHGRVESSNTLTSGYSSMGNPSFLTNQEHSSNELSGVSKQAVKSSKFGQLSMIVSTTTLCENQPETFLPPLSVNEQGGGTHPSTGTEKTISMLAPSELASTFSKASAPNSDDNEFSESPDISHQPNSNLCESNIHASVELVTLGSLKKTVVSSFNEHCSSVSAPPLSDTIIMFPYLAGDSQNLTPSDAFTAFPQPSTKSDDSIDSSLEPPDETTSDCSDESALCPVSHYHHDTVTLEKQNMLRPFIKMEMPNMSPIVSDQCSSDESQSDWSACSGASAYSVDEDYCHWKRPIPESGTARDNEFTADPAGFDKGNMGTATTDIIQSSEESYLVSCEVSQDPSQVNEGSLSNSTHVHPTPPSFVTGIMTPKSTTSANNSDEEDSTHNDVFRGTTFSRPFYSPCYDSNSESDDSEQQRDDRTLLLTTTTSEQDRLHTSGYETLILHSDPIRSDPEHSYDNVCHLDSQQPAYHEARDDAEVSDTDNESLEDFVSSVSFPSATSEVSSPDSTHNADSLVVGTTVTAVVGTTAVEEMELKNTVVLSGHLPPQHPWSVELPHADTPVICDNHSQSLELVESLNKNTLIPFMSHCTIIYYEPLVLDKKD